MGATGVCLTCTKTRKNPMVECKYRGRVIGWLVTGADGFQRYHKAKRTMLDNGDTILWMPMT